MANLSIIQTSNNIFSNQVDLTNMVEKSVESSLKFLLKKILKHFLGIKDFSIFKKKICLIRLILFPILF